MGFPLRTEIKIEKSNLCVDYNTPMLFIGSCFSDNVGGILSRLKFPVMSNPFGVLYNPVSISNSIDLAINRSDIVEENLIFQNNLWHSFSFHGSFSNVDKNTVVRNCNDSILNAHDFMKSAQCLFVTFGTAWVFESIETKQIVSNCHKLPSRQFKRFRLTVEEIVSEWKKLIDRIQKFNPALKIIFTVSPVRHFKDGAHENQLSKSTLLLAVDEIIKSCPVNQIEYFPAYEIVNDELRDYRFYANDMVHISETGIRFIFERFKESYLTSSTIAILSEIDDIVTAKEHRILSEDVMSIRKFGASMLKKIEKLNNIYPYVNFKPEFEYFKNLEGIE
jgi:hypothetical protein